jgi:hypothetical protein
MSRFYLEGAEARKRRKKKKKKRRPASAPPCSACADNEECIDGRCVSLARICTTEDDVCTTGVRLRCGEASDPPGGRSSCSLTIGGNPICTKDSSAWCRPCDAHADCVRAGWGPRAVCLSQGTVCNCADAGSALCAVPFGEPCIPPGNEGCTQDADCCSGRCQGQFCRLSGFVCLDPGRACQLPHECCSGDCATTQAGEFCTSCVALGESCATDLTCCGAATCECGDAGCTSRTCQPILG